MLLSVQRISVYNISMIYTPGNITELKKYVRSWMVNNPEKRERIRHTASANENDPDLFGWLRLWIAIQRENGVTNEMLQDVLDATE